MEWKFNPKLTIEERERILATLEKQKRTRAIALKWTGWNGGYTDRFVHFVVTALYGPPHTFKEMGVN